MNLIQNSPTNWRYIIIVAVLAAVVGGEILWFSMESIKLPETPALAAKLLTPCNTDSDCQRYIVYNQCSVYCANKDEANLQIIKKLEETKLCDPALWDVPSLNCGCVNNQCVAKPKDVVKNETVDWKIYRNEEYGFEVKYPFVYDQDERCLPRLFESRIFLGDIIFSWVDTKGLTVSEYVDQLVQQIEENKAGYNLSRVDSRTNIIFGGREAIKLVSSWCGANCSNPAQIFVRNGERVLGIWYEDKKGPPWCPLEPFDRSLPVEDWPLTGEVAEKILSTFRFLEFKEKFGKLEDGTQYVLGKVLVGFKEGVDLNSPEVVGVIQSNGGKIKDDIPNINVVVVQVSPGREQEFIAKIIRSELVEYAELDVIISPF